MTAEPFEMPERRQLPPSQVKLPEVTRMSRAEFLEMFGESYAPGQHVTFLGPTQRGKTTLSHQMLAQVVSPELRAHLLAGKPPGRDPVMQKAAQRLNLRTVEEWPPEQLMIPDRVRKVLGMNRHNGYVLRPRQGMENLKDDNENVSRHFRRCMVSCYRSKPEAPVIIVADETHLIQNEYKLKGELEAPLMRGAPVCGVWCLIQRGRYITYLAYCSQEWMIIFYDPDVDNQRRYGDIGGVDPKFVMHLASQLKTKRGDDGRSTVSEAICIKRSGPEVFIVSTD